MLTKILDKKDPAFNVTQEPGYFIITPQGENSKKVLKVVSFLYILFAVFLSSVVLLAYFKGLKIYDGREMPLWFVSVVLVSEWLPACFLIWLTFSTVKYVFNSSLIVQINILGLKRNKISIPKRSVQKLMIINQRAGSLSFSLKVQAGNREHKILWMQPYDPCLWFGNVIAEWAGIPLIEGSLGDD